MSTLDPELLPLLQEALAVLDEGFDDLPDYRPAVDTKALHEALTAAALRLRDTAPYHHPLYLGHMQKAPHPAARLAYAMSLWLNPNNHTLDGGHASSNMEREAVAEIARMFGWTEFQGHLCGGGTLANFEALWIARELRPGLGIAASAQAHFTHKRLCAVLGVPFHAIPCDDQGRMDIEALDRALQDGSIGTVVATLGTTASGAVDPLDAIAALRARHGFRLHVDASYGGYFVLADNLGAAARNAFKAISQADSISVDPHKHGLQPYGCGCILFRDPGVRRFYRHDSPYSYLDGEGPHLGEISLECSRPGAAAVALWATQRMLPLVAGGSFAAGLEAGREAALALYAALARNPRLAVLPAPQLDVVNWAVRAGSASESSRLARELHQHARRAGLHLALVNLPRSMLEPLSAAREWDAGEVTCIRACVMKPEHGQWMREILARLDQASTAALGNTAMAPALAV